MKRIISASANGSPAQAMIERPVALSASNASAAASHTRAVSGDPDNRQNPACLAKAAAMTGGNAVINLPARW
ncbi:MAG: hypothetical protein H7267_02225 [Sandarakinorhabdus sp.]|nr:hypothetical protein [Sandarakinorhabdus sp.]